MKGKMTALLMALCMIVPCGVCAEETAEEIEITGQKVLQYEMVTVPEQGRIEVRDVEFTDLVQAIDAADDSVKISPSEGNTCLDIKLIYNPLKEGQTVCGGFSCSLVADGKNDYDSRLMLEAGRSDGSDVGSYFSDVRDTRKYYLVNVAGMDDTTSTNFYYLYDYIVEVPEEIANSETAIYLNLKVGDSEFYYEVQ